MISPASWLDSRGKRLVDLSVATVLLGLSTPILVLVSALSLASIGRPILFFQRRAGKRGHPILVPKLRTMSDAVGPDGQPLPDAQRMTRFGSLLRATSLDELPQLIAVITGSMSLVGPRPLPLVYVDRYSGEQRQRLVAKPGITGWAQVNGRNATSWDRRFELDLWYVENASWRVDVRIMLQTMRALLSPAGIAAPGHVTMPEFRPRRPRV